MESLEKLPGTLQSLQPAPATEMEVDCPAPQPCKLIRHAGGITTVGLELHQQDAHARIATVVAANSGRPGGAIRAADGTVERSKVHGGHSTQEEDVVANWLLSSGHDWPERQCRFAQISWQWGLHEPHGTDTRTLQGVDYTRVFPSVGARMYADAWTLPGQTLSRKEGKRFDTHAAYPTTLVFCAGPNASAGGSAGGSMRRTFCEAAHDDRSFLEAGTAWAIYAALAAAAQSGCDVVLLPFVAGGLYAGPWRGAPGLLASFVRHIDAMLLEGLMPDGTAVSPLGGCFRKVCVVVLGRQEEC